MNQLQLPLMCTSLDCGASLTSGEDAHHHKESPQGIQASAGGWFSNSDDRCTAAPLHRHTHKKAKQHQWRHLRMSGGNLDYRRRQGCVCPLIDSWLRDMVWSFAEILTQSFTRRTVRRKKRKRNPLATHIFVPSVCVCVSFPLTHRHKKLQGWGRGEEDPAADMSQRSILLPHSQTQNQSWPS